jgi:hypothetical protein
MDKLLACGNGEQRGGYNEIQISVSDFLSKYLEDFGEVCFEFKARNLIARNKIYPFNYRIRPQYFYLDDGFPAMPFWECEWQSKKIKFEYRDINKLILFSDRLFEKEINAIVSMLKQLDISYDIMKFSKLPEPDYDCFIKRYLKRLKWNIK